jgi:hypothetical protein
MSRAGDARKSEQREPEAHRAGFFAVGACVTFML